MTDYKADNDWLRNEMATNMIYNKETNELRAEIERLQAALAKQTEQHEYPCSPHCAGYLREQAAQVEIERLRAALQEIEHETGATMLATNHGRRGDIANAIARRTLEPKPPTSPA